MMTKEKVELMWKLRKETGMGLMDCKKCLKDNEWDYNKSFINHQKYKWDGKLVSKNNQ